METRVCLVMNAVLVYPVSERAVVSYRYYAAEGTDAAKDLVVRSLRDLDFAHGTGSIRTDRLDACIRGFNAEDVYVNLKHREQARINGDSKRLGIAAVIRVEKDMYVAVPLEQMSITGAGNGRICILRTPYQGMRYYITDATGIVLGKTDAVHLRGMLMKPYKEDMRRFHAEVPARCIVDAVKGVFALLPKTEGADGKYVLHCTKRAVAYRMLSDSAVLDIPYTMNVEVRSLKDNRIYSLHASLLRKWMKARYSCSDRLSQISVPVKAVKAADCSGLELYMPQMWHVLYKDSVLSLPWNALTHMWKPAGGKVRFMLCSGMYTLSGDVRPYEVCMEELADVLDGNEYRTEPRMYIKVPYKAVFRRNSKSVCIGLVMKGDIVKKRRYSIKEFSCIMKIGNEYFRDERSIGGRIWLAVP
ncbi:MAG: hypothetical protein LUD51_05990, partial [Clostridia bacterium]|nr:hypothetical protein [Clostridia bacterium]